MVVHSGDGLARAEVARLPYDLGMRRLPADGDGLFSYEEALAAGYSCHAIGRRRRDGVWREVQPRVYHDASNPLSFRARLRAAQRSCPGLVVSHRAAATLLGMTRVADEVVEGTLVGVGRPRLRGVVVHRAGRLASDEVVTVDGIRCTSVARTLVDCAALVSQSDCISLVDDTVALRGVRAARVYRCAVAAPRNHRHRRLVASLTAPGAAATFASWLEREAERAFVAAALPRGEWNARLYDESGTFLGRVDVCWRLARLVVELDGLRFHRSAQQRRDDQARQNNLTIAGWRVLRFTWRDVVEEPDRVVAEISAALRSS